MNAALIIEAARVNAASAVMLSSAEHCLSEAEARLAEGNAAGACMWAMKSLAYSVGILSPVYREARMACA